MKHSQKIDLIENLAKRRGFTTKDASQVLAYVIKTYADEFIYFLSEGYSGRASKLNVCAAMEAVLDTIVSEGGRVLPGARDTSSSERGAQNRIAGVFLINRS